MLNFESSSLSWVRSARADERRNSRRDTGALCRLALLNVGAGLDDTRLETGGATDGTAGTAMLGGGGAGIRAALPTPLGSLTELLRPPALPGPRGIPLTPASPAPWAKHGAGAARQPANARAKKHDLPNIDHASHVERGRCANKTTPAQGDTLRPICGCVGFSLNQHTGSMQGRVICSLPTTTMGGELRGRFFLLVVIALLGSRLRHRREPETGCRSRPFARLQSVSEIPRSPTRRSRYAWK